MEALDASIVVDGEAIPIFAERDPGTVPWEGAGVEIVIESTGLFTDGNLAKAHLGGTVRKVVISAPAKNEDKTLVLGVNDAEYDPKRHHVVSNASCTTNGLAPPVQVLLDNFGIIKGQMTTVHSYTTTQRLLHIAPNHLRVGPAAGISESDSMRYCDTTRLTGSGEWLHKPVHRKSS